jgi:hypothetical protein
MTPLSGCWINPSLKAKARKGVQAMKKSKNQSDVVVLRSIQMGFPISHPITLAIDEKGEFLIDVRISMVDLDVLVDRLNAEGTELYLRHDAALVPIEWVKTLSPGSPSFATDIQNVEQMVKSCFRALPESYLTYRPVTEVGEYENH